MLSIFFYLGSATTTATTATATATASDITSIYVFANVEL